MYYRDFLRRILKPFFVVQHKKKRKKGRIISELCFYYKFKIWFKPTKTETSRVKARTPIVSQFILSSL